MKFGKKKLISYAAIFLVIFVMVFGFGFKNEARANGVTELLWTLWYGTGDVNVFTGGMPLWMRDEVIQEARGDEQQQILALDEQQRLGNLSPAEVAELKSKIAQNTVKTTDDINLRAKNSVMSTQEVIGNVLGWLFYYVSYGLGFLVSKMIGVMLTIAAYPLNFKTVPVVSNAWSIIRDLCNNFFLVILLIIAVANTLDIKAYNYKALLPKLLVMAVLINFSLMFTGIMIDASQVLMLTFAQPLATIQGNNIIMAAIGLPDLYSLAIEQGVGTAAKAANTSIGIAQIITALMFALIVTVVALVVISCISIILIIRIVYLLFLAILSPLPFLLNTFPRGQSYAGQWWSEMAKNLTVGPVMLFFLWVSFMAMSGAAGDSNVQFQQKPGQTAIAASITAQTDNPLEGNGISANDATRNSGDAITKAQLNNLTSMMTIPGVVNFMMVIGLMVASLVMAQQSGATGAKWAGKGMGLLTKMGKGASFGAAGKLGKRTLGSERVSGALSSAANNRVLKWVPGIGAATRASGRAREQLETKKAKKLQEQTSAMAAAANIKGQDQAGLEKLAKESKNKQIQIAAAQELASRGMLKDDPRLDPTQRKNRIDIISKTRENLSSNQDLQKAFDENIIKYSAGFALESSMFTGADGKTNLEKLKSALTTGKMDIKNLMGGISAGALDKLDKELNVSGDGDLNKFLINQSKDDEELKKIYGAMSSDTKKMLFDGKRNKHKNEQTGKWEWDDGVGVSKISHKTFKDAKGDIDEDMRKKFLKASPKVSKAFNLKKNKDGEFEDKIEVEKAREYGKKDTANFVKNVDADEINAEFMEVFSEVFSTKNIDDIKARGREFTEKVETSLGDAIANINLNKMTSEVDEKLAKSLIKHGLLQSAEVLNNSKNFQPEKGGNDSIERRAVITEIMRKSTGKDLGRMKNLNDDQKLIVAKNVKPNVKKSLAFTDNKALYDYLDDGSFNSSDYSGESRPMPEGEGEDQNPES